MVTTTTEISVQGKWIKVPALTLGGKTIVVRGRWIKTATVQAEEWLETELDDPESCVRQLKAKSSHGLRVDIFSFAQKPPDILPKYHYPMEWDSLAAVPISTFKEWWENLPQESRKNVRRSQKRGVVVRVAEFNDELIRGIVDINNDSRVRQGRQFTHYRKSMEEVKRDHSSYLNRSDFICAYFGGELIGFLKIVYRGDIASILQLLAKSTHYDKRPTNALLAEAVDLCGAKGMRFLTYGRFNIGNKRDSSMREFKVRNGFQEVLVPRFWVPLTPWGSACLKLKLHRGLLGMLPSSVIKGVVSVRAKWYDTRRALSRCSSIAEQPNRNRLMECANPPAGSNPSSPADPLRPAGRV